MKEKNDENRQNDEIIDSIDEANEEMQEMLGNINIIKNPEDIFVTNKEIKKESKTEIKDAETMVALITKRQTDNDICGFVYKSKCRCCNYALNDPEIHSVYLIHDFSIQPVVDYINEKYGDTPPIVWEQVKNHMTNHFLPKYKEVEFKRKKFITDIRKRLRDKEKEKGKSYTRIAELHEILYSKIEELCIYSDIKNDKQNRENARVIAQLTVAIKSLYELEYKMMGMDEDPEEYKARIQNMLKLQLNAILQRMPEEKQKEFMDYIYKQNN